MMMFSTIWRGWRVLTTVLGDIIEILTRVTRMVDVPVFAVKLLSFELTMGHNCPRKKVLASKILFLNYNRPNGNEVRAINKMKIVDKSRVTKRKGKRVGKSNSGKTKGFLLLHSRRSLSNDLRDNPDDPRTFTFNRRISLSRQLRGATEINRAFLWCI